MQSSDNSNLTTKYIRSSFIFVFLSLISAAINYAYYPVIAHFLTAGAFGATQALIAILLQIGAIFSGLNLVTIYLVHKLDDRDSRQAVETLQKITVSLFLLATLLITVGQTAVLHFLHIDHRLYLFLVTLDLLTTIPFIITFGYLQAQKRFIAAGSLQVVIVVVKLIAGALATKQFGASGALAGILIGQVVGMALFWIICNMLGIKAWDHKVLQSIKLPSSKGLKLIRPYAKNIIAIFCVNVLLFLFISFDIIAARHYFTSSISGLYAGASTVSNAIVFVCLPLISVLLPHLDATVLARSKKYLYRSSAMVVVISILSVIILRVLPRPILELFGAQYTAYSFLLWRLGILMSLVAGISLVLQVSAFYAPIRTALISGLGFIALLIAVWMHHETPVTLVSTIMPVFATILVVGGLQLIWLYNHAPIKN